MSIRTHLEAALRIDSEPTPQGIEKLGHLAVALGEACLAVSNGDDAAMNDLYDAIEAGVDSLEDPPGWNPLSRKALKMGGKAIARNLRNRVHHE